MNDDAKKEMPEVLREGDWQLALEVAGDDEGARAEVLGHFGLVPCPECEGMSDGDFYDCPCCDSVHYVDDVDLSVWRRSPYNPANAPRHWEPEAA